MLLRTWILLGGVLIGLGIFWWHTRQQREKIKRSPEIRDLIRVDRLTTDHLIDEATKYAGETAKEIRELRQQLEDKNSLE